MVGQDAVVVTLGISDNPFKRAVAAPGQLAARRPVPGTAKVIDAMRAAGVRRLVVQSTYGIGETYGPAVLAEGVLHPGDPAPGRATTYARRPWSATSGLDWTVVRPVVLDDDPADAPAKVDLEDRVASMKVSRTQLARVLADAVDRDDWRGRTVSVSA